MPPKDFKEEKANMKDIKKMLKWSYEEAWQFFTENAFHREIPETQLYIRSLNSSLTQDLRDDKNARKKILESLKKKSLILLDGSSCNGKSTFANRLAKQMRASVVDIDLICKEWVEEQLKRITNPMQEAYLYANMDELTDMYVLKNLQRIVKEKSKAGTVILVGCYMEVVYRAIIANTLGQYFDQVVSIYCCAKSFKDIEMMIKKRDEEFGYSQEIKERIWREYVFSQKLLEYDGIVLGLGMAASFITDIKVSDMFA